MNVSGLTVLFLVKVLAALLQPLTLSLLLLMVGLLVRRMWPRVSVIVVVTTLLGLWGMSMPYAAHRLGGALEACYPPVPIQDLPAVDAIVVLGGGVEAAVPPRLEVELGPASDRVWYAAQLYQAGKAPFVLVTGGSLPWSDAGAEAPAMQRLLEAWGVPASAIVQEDRSRTTRENAVYSAPILQARGVHSVLLVTSALHMPRARATFAKVGIDAVPATTDVHVVAQARLHVLDFLPDPQAAAFMAYVIKEYQGLFYYRLRGWL